MSDDDEVVDLGHVKRVMFDLDMDSASIVLVEHAGEDVLTTIPGGGLLAFGEPITPNQLADALRKYLDDRFLH